jgi:hypothetical protein
MEVISRYLPKSTEEKDQKYQDNYEVYKSLESMYKSLFNLQ